MPMTSPLGNLGTFWRKWTGIGVSGSMERAPEVANLLFPLLLDIPTGTNSMIYNFSVLMELCLLIASQKRNESDERCFMMKGRLQNSLLLEESSVTTWTKSLLSTQWALLADPAWGYRRCIANDGFGGLEPWPQKLTPACLLQHRPTPLLMWRTTQAYLWWLSHNCIH